MLKDPQAYLETVFSMADSPQSAGAGRGDSEFSRDLPKEYTIYSIAVIFSAHLRLVLQHLCSIYL